jgi:hypothetical protein
MRRKKDKEVKEFTFKWYPNKEEYGSIYIESYGDKTLISKKKWDYIRLTEFGTVDEYISKLKIYAEKNGLKDEDGVKYTLSADSANATIEQVREKWSKYNQDKASKLAFGEAKSPDQGFARNLAKNNAIQEFGKKLNAQEYEVKGAVIKEEKMYFTPDKLYISLMVVEVDTVTVIKQAPEPNLKGNSAMLDDKDNTLITGTAEKLPEIEMAEYFSTSMLVTGTAIKNGQTYKSKEYTFDTTTTTEDSQKSIWDKIYTELAANIYASNVKLGEQFEGKQTEAAYKVKKTSFKITTIPPNRPKKQKKPKPTPLEKPFPPKAVSKKQEIYQPKTRVSKPSSTRGGEFIEKESGKEYKGTYVKAYKDTYYAGSSLDQKGVELKEAVAPVERNPFITLALNLGLAALQGFLEKLISNGDRLRGKTKRYFIKAKNSGKVSEVSKDTYQQAQTTLPNQIFAEIDWVIKGPAEDKNINGYMYEGAESKNKKTIQALEKQMPGVSLLIKDYKFLVEEPITPEKLNTTSQEVIVKDLETRIENDRKANFDHKR